MTYVLETQRLILKKFTDDDAELIFSLLNSPGWLKYIGNRNIKTPDDAKNYITEKLQPGYQKYGFGFYLAQIKDTNEKIGMCGLVKRESLDDIDIGFALLPEFEGNGYALEAASAVMDYAKETLKIKQIAAITLPYNTGSIKVLEKLGMSFVKNIRLPNDNDELMLYIKILN